MVAEMLGLPSVSVAVKLEIADGKATVEREIEGGKEKVQTTLPAVFTAQKGLNEPRNHRSKESWHPKTNLSKRNYRRRFR